jgi:hypothetical protein
MSHMSSWQSVSQPRVHSARALGSSKCRENVQSHPQLIHMRRRKLRDCSLPMISGKPAGHVASGCGRTGAAITASATTTMRGGGGGPSMSCPCGTLCIAAASSDCDVDGRQQARRRKVADCYASALSKLVQLYRAREESTVYILLCNPRYNCTTWQRLGASLGLIWGKSPKVLNSTCFGADYTVRDHKIPT